MKTFRVTRAVLLAALLAAAPNLWAAWLSDGVAVITVTGAQDTPAIVSDGADGAIIAWRDYRTANTDIYAQRVDAGGALLWTSTGMPVCTANNLQSLPLMVPDGSGGALVAWQDFRSNNVLDIYAQRINSNGYAQWTANGVAVCVGQTGLTLTAIAADGAGGAIVTWYDRRGGTNDIFAQRIDGSGAVQWTANGVTICAATGNQISPAIATDGANGAIIAWTDGRSGTNDIYAQRVNASGAVQWTADGVVVCDAAQYQTVPQVAPDGSGGAIVTWSDHRNAVDYDVFAQRLDASGAAQWTAGGVVVSQTTGNQQNSYLVPIGSGETIVAWMDYRSGGSDIYAQRMNASGAAQWTANGVAVSAATNNQITVRLIQDVTGGAIATWEDARVSTSDYNLYARKINANGTIAWTTDGVALCTATGNQTTPAIAPDGHGGAFVAWKDERSGAADIYAQRVDAGGHTVVATLLQSSAARLVESGIEVSWTLFEADASIEFGVLRAEAPSETFVEMPGAAIERDGLAFSFVDASCEPGSCYRYRVDVSDSRGRRALFETEPLTAPAARPTLAQNVPNPFNPTTAIGYYLPERRRVVVEVFDLKGNLVRTLVAAELERGFHTATWNGLDRRGAPAGSGVYWCRLTAGKETLSRKMILLR